MKHSEPIVNKQSLPAADVGPRPICSASDITTANLRNTFILWQSSTVKGCGPADLDLLQVSEILPMCIKFRLSPGQDIEDAQVTYEGDRLVKSFGDDLTGKTIGELEQYVTAHRLTTACATEMLPMMSGPEKVVSEQNNFLNIEHICLPLSADGQNLTGLFYVVVYLNL